MTATTPTAAPWFTTRRQPPPDDPVNLVFYGNAPAAAVSRLLRRTLRPRWHRWGFGRWAADLALGSPLWGRRRHIRIYDCLTREHGPDEPELGVWSIATVHLEHWDFQRRTHVVDSWNEPRAYLKAAFAALGPPRVGAILDVDRGAAGVYHRQRFDGVVTYVELLDPPA